jgi:heptosyltransferase III
MVQRTLIFRRGSIGDAVVSLPALSAIRDRSPEAELAILTNAPVMGRAAHIEAVLGRADLISEYFSLPPGGGGISSMRQVRSAIKSWSPDKLIYLSEPSSIISLLKEYLFFKACGIKNIEAMPFAQSLREYQPKSDNIWESESERLLRAVGLPWPAKLEINFSDEEQNQAEQIITDKITGNPFITFSIGGKLPDKDWGDANWSFVLEKLSAANPSLGLLLIGAEDESVRSAALAQNWRGPVLNLCGKTKPRLSALAMKQAIFYLGHDSGPMHLAALMEVPCIALFSARAKPGAWFPHGDNHHIFYPWEMADSVSNKAGFRTAGSSILSNKHDEVIEACRKLLI